MRGSIRARGNSWQITIDTGISAEGKRKRHIETIHGKESDARKRRDELLVDIRKGIYSSPGRLTVAEHLHNWLEGYCRTNCSQRTLDGYQSIIEHHLIPA